MIALATALFALVVLTMTFAYGTGTIKSHNPRQPFTLVSTKLDGGFESVSLRGRTKVGLQYKLNPVWWFLNDEDPIPPDWYNPSWPQAARIIGWYVRNPLHNFGSYVFGVEDRNYSVIGHDPLDWVFWSDIGDRTGIKATVLYPGWFILPGFTYDSKRIQVACGWRLHGRFALKFRIKS